MHRRWNVKGQTVQFIHCTMQVCCKYLHSKASVNLYLNKIPACRTHKRALVQMLESECLQNQECQENMIRLSTPYPVSQKPLSHDFGLKFWKQSPSNSKLKKKLNGKT
jgi:hypothetical protein